MSGPRGLLVVGHVVTDVVALLAGPLAADTDTPASVAVRPGGAGGNTAAWAARCGADATVLARVGADSADRHRAALLADGVRPRLVVDPQLPTAVVIALVGTDAERTLVTDSRAAVRLGPGDWSDRLLDGAGHLHLSGYLYFSDEGRAVAARAAATAARRSVPVSVDPASAGFVRRTGTAAFRAAVAGAGLLLPNADEARLLTGGLEPADAAAELTRDHATVVVTLGAAGALVARRGRPPVTVPAPRVRAVDTTGAGDAFTGGFLAALLRGADPVRAAAEGCAAGARAVTVVGARPGPR